MGEYADMALADSLDNYWGEDYSSWGWRRHRSPPSKTCERCGQTGLVWSAGPKYVLEEFVYDESTKTGRYKPHTCKFKGFGNA